MIKTIIYKFEDVILNEEILRFKYYELLWQYLRRQRRWKKFDQLVKLRNFLVSEVSENRPYLTIAKQYLSPRDYEKFRYEIKWFTERHANLYLRLIPGMRAVIQTTRYYYKISTYSYQRDLFEKALNRFKLEKTFHYTVSIPQLRDDQLNVNFLQNILNETQTNPDETILVSDKLQPDIAAAKRLGIFTIQTKFDIKTKGLLTQGVEARKYFEAISSTSKKSMRLLRPLEVADAVAKNPEEINRAIQTFEAGESRYQPREEREQEVNFWDIAKEIFAPNSEWEEKSH